MVYDTGIPHTSFVGRADLGNHIWMQSTGLTDKNGKEIFEGDLVRHADYGSVSVVEWSNGNWGWQMRTVAKWNPKSGFDSSVDQVIGNLYEKPDLLIP